MSVRKFWIPALVVMVMSIGLVGCNSKAEDDPDYTISSNVAVSDFYIKSDKTILSNLDSVFFSIDLKKRLIFNADSLPKGTDIRKLIPVITLPGTASAVKITMTGGEYRTGEVDYLKSANDSIDFTGQVILTIVAQDGVSSCDYTVKVNVHNMEPDSLWWDQMAMAELPSRLPAPKRQKSVEYTDKVVTLVAENDGSYTISATDNLTSGQWVQQSAIFEFNPDVRSFTATDEAFYILNTEGRLYSSSDAVVWNPTEESWQSIIGGYESRLLGLKSTDSGLTYVEYSSNGAKELGLADSDFPVKGHSQFKTFTNKWVNTPVGLMTGGVTMSGEYTGTTWGFDGQNWAQLSSHPAPAVDGGVMIPYYAYTSTTGIWLSSEYSVWLFVGGQLADGSFNRTMYLSWDNGVNWVIGGELIQLPEYIPGMKYSDCIVKATSMSGNFEPKVWTPTASKELPGWYRVNYEVNGYDVTWECPYIYLIGGEDAEGLTYNTIWKGVLNRLTFVPLM